MKYLLILLLFLSFLSCTTDKTEYTEVYTSNNFPQKWELVQMNFPSENKQQNGLQMSWQESYLLLPDSTFLKKRMTATETIVAEGKFYTEKKDQNTYLRFEYDKAQKSSDISNFATEERLLISKEDKMVLISKFNGRKQILDYKLK